MPKILNNEIIDSCYQCDHHFPFKAGRKCMKKKRWVWLPDYQIPEWCPLDDAEVKDG